MTASINPRGIPLLDVGRDVQGRFRPCNPGGPGNPFARKVAAPRKALLDETGRRRASETATMEDDGTSGGFGGAGCAHGVGG